MSVHRARSRLAQLRCRDRGRDRRREHQREKKKRAGPLFVMPYGAHRGKAILLVPIAYLQWMVREDHTLAKRAAQEIGRRDRIRARAGEAP